MPKQEGQKSKLLALLRIFEQQTDENHLLNVPQLVELLETPAAPLIWRSSSCWWMPCRQAGWYPAPRAGG